MNLRTSKILLAAILMAATFLPLQAMAQSIVGGTLTVAKDFSDNNDIEVQYTAICTDATFDSNGQASLNGTVSEGNPDVLDVSWDSKASPTCLVNEQPINGYTENSCPAAPLVVDGNLDCTLVNTQNPVNVEVSLAFTEFHPIADSEADIELFCSGGTITDSTLTTSGGVATFEVSDFPFENATCDAVIDVPPGYVLVDSVACEDMPIAPTDLNPAAFCTVTLRPTEATFTVGKEFSDGNPGPVIDVDVDCEEGVQGPGIVYSPTDGDGQASQNSDLVVTVKWFGTNSFCHASESDIVGYSSISDPGGSNCGADNDIDDENDNSCQFYNDQDPIIIQASKVYSDGGSSAVDFAIECANLDTGGTVAPPTASASPGNPAEFEVNDIKYDGSTICSVTEPVPPGGYYVSATTCEDMALYPDSDDPRTCEITNSPTRATFRVTKHFEDGNNVDEVTVSIDCNTGLILDQDKDLGDNEWVEFVVTDFTEGVLECVITEDGETGYSGEYENLTITGAPVLSDDSCFYDSTEIVGNSEHECVITNSPDPVEVNIYKDWVFQGTTEPDIDMRIDVYLSCTSEIVDFSCNQLRPATIDGPFDTPSGVLPYPYVAACYGDTGPFDVAMFALVKPDFPTTTCVVEEVYYDQAIEQDNGCGVFQVSVNNGHDCVITNTVFFEGIPTLSQYGMAILALLMLGVGFVSFRRFS